MKKIKLFLAAIAAMVTMGVNAQSWTASEVGAGNYVIYNVGSGQFLTAGNAWGTQASITTGGVSGATQVELIANDGNWFIRTGVGGTSNGLENLAAAGDVYMDQSRGKQSTWTFTQVATDNGPVYNIISAANHGGGSGAYLTANSSNTVVSDNGEATSAYAQWKLLEAAKVPLLSKIEEYQEVRATVMGFAANTSAYTDEVGAANTLTSAVTAQDDAVNNATTTSEIDDAISAVKAAGNTFLESVIITAGFDVTNVWITNPAPGISGNLTGWTNSGSPGLQNQLYEYWNVSAGTTKQTLSNLPKGAYKLTAIAYTRTGMNATLYAGDNSMYIATVSNSTVNDRAQGSNWIAAGNGVNDLNFTLDAATASLEIGLIADNTTSDYWMCWRSFSLTYYGDPINLKKAELAAAVAAAQAVDGSTIPTAAKDAIDAAVTANNQTWSTEAEYDAAISAINTAVSTSASAEIVAAYAIVIDAKAMYNQTDYTDKDNAKATFKALIDAADATTNLADLNAAIVNLKAGLTPFISTVTLNENAFFDVTNFFVVNPSVSQNTTGWTIEGTPNGGYSWGVCNYGECEFYNNNFKFYQTLALTPGTWEFGVTGFHRAGNHNTNFYAGVDKILIPGVESSVVNSMAAAETYFNGGNGKVALKFLIESAQDVEIGINNQDTETDKWTIFRDFTLKYYGAPDYSIYEDRLAELANEAAAFDGTLPTAAYTALNNVVTTYNTTHANKAEYIAAIEAVENAIAEAKTKQGAYAAFKSLSTAVQALYDVANYEELSTGAHDALGTALTDAANAVETKTTVDDINAVAETLRAAGATYAGAANPTGTAKFNLTFMLTNPDVSSFAAWTPRADVPGWYTDQTDGNSQTMVNDGATSEDGTKTNFFEYWSNPAKANDAFALYQKVTLPVGTFDINCYAFAQDQYAGTNSVGVYFYANDTQGSAVTTARLTQAGISFVNATEQEVKIGLKTIAGNSYNWMGIGYVELYKVPAKVVTIDENADYVAENAAAKVELKRTIKADVWNTFVVPFQLGEAELKAAFGDDVQIAEFSDSGADKDNVTVGFNTMATPAITPNKPVLLKTSTSGTSYTFEGRTIVPVEGDAKVAGNFFDFVGTYAASTTIAAGNYFISGDKLYKSAGGTTIIKGTRAYLQDKNPDQPAGEVKLFIDDIETAIETIDADVTENGIIYNVAGQRVNNAQKGIYIVNGKKVLVK